ncbi:TRP-domain-containing protein [Rhizodiscina lignyota]|uniref:TRP-domain-containing protein n=1 Tax=Rhizodiscina lignyota TaxID=1504668 RepID=A0A9P4I5F2_9PEZI|nr:TRP-domain-containing protein [Rhizodiscina lignyota]
MSPITYLLAALVALAPFTTAEKLLESTSLNPCIANSKFSATLFNVLFTPNNGTLAFTINGVSAISGNVTAQIDVIAYGLNIYSTVIKPCDNKDFAGLCPMNTGPIDLKSNTVIPQSTVEQIPVIAFSIPDLDGKVQVYINDTDTGAVLACVEAELSNGKSVYQKAVGWVTAIIAGIGLVTSAITSGLGHTNTAAHVAANALSLFGYFQAQAFIGMCAVPLPPIVASWTQNFAWSMGIIRVAFLQQMATWYQRSTGGTPSSFLSSLATTSVAVQKRSLDYLEQAYQTLVKRSNNQNTNAETLQVVTIRGIERVGFRANIEITNIFFTGYTFFIIFVLFVVLAVAIFKFVCEGLVRSGKMKSDKFLDFRNGWKTVLKGILFRIVLIGFPQMVVICFWELTVRDSPAEVVLAIATIVVMLSILAWAALKVWRIAQRSIAMHKNPAYILYSDPVALNKWGFLYVQFRATAYYFVVPILLYILVKGMFIGLAQKSGVTQAVSLVIIEAASLIALSVMRPYMDKKTNGFNIAIAAVNFLGAIFLLVFSNVFNQPGIVTGVMGVIFFIFNAVFALILLLMVLIASVYALSSKNPDTRYQPMRDDRGSFIKSQTQLNVGAELDALGATARGDKGSRILNNGFGSQKARSTIDDDDSSFESEVPSGMQSGNLHPPNGGGHYRDNSYSSQYGQSPTQSSTFMPAAGYNGAPAPGSRNGGGGGYRPPQSASPWQRGAGYE